MLSSFSKSKGPIASKCPHQKQLEMLNNRLFQGLGIKKKTPRVLTKKQVESQTRHDFRGLGVQGPPIVLTENH